MSLDALGGRLLSAADVRARYPGAWWLEVLEYGDAPPPVRVIEHGLALEALAPGRGPWALVVEGDLTVRGDLDLSTGDYAVSLLVVQGTLRGRHLRFTNGANCVVRDDAELAGVVLGRHGDESARLAVGGALRAQALLLDHVTGCEAARIDAVVRSSPGWGLPMDIPASEERAIFAPAALDDDGELSLRAAWQVVTRGDDLFLPGAHARLRAARPAPFVRDRDEA